MGRYRKIEARIWIDKKFQNLSPIKSSGQGLWLFLLTVPQNGPMPGLIHAGRLALAEELGWKQKQFDAAFKELEEQGMVKADFTKRLIWIPNAVKYNGSESPNVILSGKKSMNGSPNVHC